MAFEVELGAGSTAVSIRASLENLIKSLEPALQKMTAIQLTTFMQPHIDKAFKRVVRRWRALLTRKGIDSSWTKPSGEPHIADALFSGRMKVIPAGRLRKIIEWEILSAADHLVFTLEGFGDVGTSTPDTWGRQASLAAWANQKFGWKIPISDGIVDDEAAKKITVSFAGRKVSALTAIIALSRAVTDNRLRSYGLADSLSQFIQDAVFRDEGLIGAFLDLASDFDI